MNIYQEIEQELFNILDYWENNAVDKAHGGFYGRRNQQNELIQNAVKGSVLNSRILWTFSAAFKYTGAQKHLLLAERAYAYIRDYFYDTVYGGVYWTVDYAGNPLDTKKQTYALSFAVYGLSEYYSVSQNEEALQLAIRIFETIEAHCFDTENGGYFEAFGRDWSEIPDLRLSDKDANEKKTMNTHLHILEAYTNLYRYWKSDRLKNQLKGLLQVFEGHIIHPETFHLNLFMDEKWRYKEHIISYGHDIEASWLLQEAAEVSGEQGNMETVMKLASAAREGLLADGSLMYEKNLSVGHQIKEKHWWVQAEAMVGFYNAFQHTKDESYYNTFQQVWAFIKAHILDRKNGEWLWGVDAQNKPLPNEDKLGLWKCPYHNVRACLEILRRNSDSATEQFRY
ncbi:N-acyl-D-glucosamine 2-epimerase (plasmid) [Pedobacter sp. BS3]|uniref:AGE family epimerase/isomerase n=1 Tax=Pedobacter sp. BS3 TaxID=2567937 RepID=UPI0011F01EF9|nr:AGE family epimerase/isomerase [Pedobacter sp. BS3]TZF86033.1 N-acyl-D-glucosamine 2-epimerase [Pedobacter sp. BS3]